MASANDYKDRLEKIIDESIGANSSQIMQGTSNFEDYKYIQNIVAQTKEQIRGVVWRLYF